MKILHYVPRTDLRDGGVPRFVLDIARVLSAHGHCSTILADDTTDTPASWLVDDTRPSEPPHDHRLPRVISLGKPGIADHFFTPEAMDRVREELSQADVLHLHCLWATTCMQLAAQARDMGVPYIISLHGMLDDWSMAQRYLKKRVYLSLGGRYFLEKAWRIHCTATAEAEQARRWLPMGSTVVIPYLIDLELYRELPGPDAAHARFPFLNEDKPTILFLSRLHYKKNPEALLEAAAMLARSGHDFNLAIAGTGESEYVDSLRRKAESLNIAKRTHFVGHVGGVEKTSLYQACDLFVLPTSQENLGLVLIESMACGTLVVTTKGVDIWRDIQGSGGAAIVEPTAEGLCGELASLLQQPRILDRMGQKARTWALRQFDEHRLIARFEELYGQAAARTATLRMTRLEPPGDLRASA
ncbi:MAG TPA: glycosyltransferase [Phycisphaerales bacterium]|nr:glycosyltransferase [Phycisphaerales bacterium]